ncbi:MAG: hypothetical protein ACTSYG_07605 [Candidatus Heimdallarchaeota archaeon]
MVFKKKEDKETKKVDLESIGENFIVVTSKEMPLAADYDLSLVKGFFPVSVCKPYGGDWYLVFTKLNKSEPATSQEFIIDGITVNAMNEVEAKAKVEQIKKIMR